MNPHIILPVFLSFTQNCTNLERNRIAKKMLLYGLFLGFSFLLCGETLLGLLGVSNDAFKIGGGLLLSVGAWNLLYGEEEQAQGDSVSGDIARSNIALCPLTFPMFIGPATLTTSVNLMVHAKQSGWGEQVIVVCAFGAVVVISYFFMLFGGVLIRLLRKSGTVILQKVGGILLIALSIEMIVSGAKSYFKIAEVASDSENISLQTESSKEFSQVSSQSKG